ncbi:hypothetical protein [Leucobacter japonicus]|uniref:hypothetical protein n=1 Tax=Leucobacter japonicus TaxID=1461259 RepID=UPI0012E217AA|nr:hypothetical protein [Leucobacter japonicus]
MNFEIDPNTLKTLALFAGGAGALGAAIISAVVLLFNGSRTRKQARDFRDREITLADERLQADRDHSIEVLRVQSEIARDDAVYANGREKAMELLELLGVLQTTWTHVGGYDYFEVNRDALRAAEQKTFSIPDPITSQIVSNGLRYIGNAWVGPRTEGTPDTARHQNAEMHRIKSALSNYIARRQHDPSILIDQEETIQVMNKLFVEYFDDK